MKKLLVVDRTQENASLKIFPNQPLLSSFKAGWNHIIFEYHEQKNHSVLEHLPAQNVIVINHQPLKARLMIGDDVRDEHIETGEILVNPAYVSHSSCWEESASFTLLFFEPEYIARVAYEFIDPDRVELIPTFAQTDPAIYGIELALRKRLESHQQTNQMYIDTTSLFLAHHLLEYYCSNKKIQKSASVLSRKDLSRVNDYINTHLDQDLGLEVLANLVGLSHYYFARSFKQSTGVSPRQYLIKSRVERATRLLMNTNLEISEIATRTGFSSHSHFSFTFRKHLFVSPEQYRQTS